MDAASYAVERNRNLQDNVQKIIQMMLMGKQNKQEQDWRQGQFDYQKSQDTIRQGQQERSLDRQDAQQKRYEEYQQSLAQHYANMDEQARNKPVKVEPTPEQELELFEKKAKITAANRRPATPPKPDQPSSLAERHAMFLEIAKEKIANKEWTNKQATDEWTNYVLGKNGQQPSAFDQLVNSQTGTPSQAKEPAIGATGKAKDGTTVYYKGNGKWSSVR
jgi:hypothetical protein